MCLSWFQLLFQVGFLWRLIVGACSSCVAKSNPPVPEMRISDQHWIDGFSVNPLKLLCRRRKQQSHRKSILCSASISTRARSSSVWIIFKKINQNLELALGMPSREKSAVFLNIVQKAFDPPPFYLNILFYYYLFYFILFWTFVLFCRGCFLKRVFEH